MRAMWAWGCVILCITAWIAGARAQTLPHRPDPQAGQQLAMRVCDACHVVAAHQELSPLVPNYGPSFFEIARRPAVTMQALAQFLARPHPLGRMPYPELSPAQIANVSAYIISLRQRR